MLKTANERYGETKQTIVSLYRSRNPIGSFSGQLSSNLQYSKLDTNSCAEEMAEIVLLVLAPLTPSIFLVSVVVSN